MQATVPPTSPFKMRPKTGRRSTTISVIRLSSRCSGSRIHSRSWHTHTEQFCLIITHESRYFSFTYFRLEKGELNIASVFRINLSNNFEHLLLRHVNLHLLQNILDLITLNLSTVSFLIKINESLVTFVFNFLS